MAEPSPGFVNGFGQVAAELGGRPGDQDGVLVVGLVAVRSSVFRAHNDSMGCTHTYGMPRSAANCPSTRQRCPVGSHATVTPAYPAFAARCFAQSRAAPRPTPCTGTSGGQVDPDDGVGHRDRLA